MCGLAGYSGKDPINLYKYKVLLLLNQTRGEDSTGVFGNRLYKELGKATRVTANAGFNNAVEGATLVVGHTRKSSRGGISLDFAHPHKVGQGSNLIYGTHNGTISAWQVGQAAKELNIAEDESDSRFIYQALANKTSNGTVDGKPLESIMGAMTLAFAHHRKLFIYRRDATLAVDDRELYYGYDANGNMYYSSIEQALHIIDCVAVSEIPKGHLLCFKDGVLESALQLTTPTYKSMTSRGDDEKKNKHSGGHHVTKPWYRTNSGHSNTQLSLNAKDENGSSKSSGGTNTDTEGITINGGALDRAKLTAMKLISHIENQRKAYAEEIETVQANAIQSDLGDDYLSCTLFVRAVDSEKGYPLPYVTIQVRHHETKYTTYTNEDGYAVLYFPQQFFPNLVDDKEIILDVMTMFADAGAPKFFGSRVKVATGRVLGVTLNLPFRKTASFTRFLHFHKSRRDNGFPNPKINTSVSKETIKGSEDDTGRTAGNLPILGRVQPATNKGWVEPKQISQVSVADILNIAPTEAQIFAMTRQWFYSRKDHLADLHDAWKMSKKEAKEMLDSVSTHNIAQMQHLLTEYIRYYFFVDVPVTDAHIQKLLYICYQVGVVAGELFLSISVVLTQANKLLIKMSQKQYQHDADAAYDAAYSKTFKDDDLEAARQICIAIKSLNNGDAEPDTIIESCKEYISELDELVECLEGIRKRAQDSQTLHNVSRLSDHFQDELTYFNSVLHSYQDLAEVFK